MSRPFIAVLCVLAAATSAHAQQADVQHPDAPSSDATQAVASSAPPAAQPLTLDAALALAELNHPLLRSARAETDAAIGAVMQAGARPNPELSLLQEGLSGRERTSTALLNQAIELGGKRAARLDAAASRRAASLAELDARAAALQADVISAFYTLLAAQRQLQVAEEAAQVAERSARIASKRVQAGKVPPVEATKAQVAASAAHIEAAGARRQLAIARQQLANATGSSLPAGQAASGNLEAMPVLDPLPQLLQRANEGPALRVAQAQTSRAQAAIAVERTRRVPDITISAGMKRIATSGAPINQAVIGISIPLPLFDTNRGALLEATHLASKASADEDSARARVRLELTQAYTNYANAVDEATRLQTEVLPAARDALDATSRGYELGRFALLDVLDAQRTLFQGRSQYVAALGSAHRAYADLARLTGEAPARTQTGHATSSFLAP
jgi:outer membrane protein, heavy metal efflux system